MIYGILQKKTDCDIMELQCISVVWLNSNDSKVNGEIFNTNKFILDTGEIFVQQLST